MQSLSQKETLKKNSKKEKEKKFDLGLKSPPLPDHYSSKVPSQ